MRIVEAKKWTKKQSVELSIFAAELCLKEFEKPVFRKAKYCSMKCAYKNPNNRRRLGMINSKEHNEKISKAHKGLTTWNKGKPMSEDQKRKIGTANTGRTWSKSLRKVISESLKNYSTFICSIF